jgi:transcriptional regulator with XRE-family HTH domain
MQIGEKIRTLRKAKKRTQEQLAEALHVSPQAVSKWETGASLPDVETLPRLAAYFGATMDELFDFDRRRLDAEVEALVAESVPLRAEPARAEAFYRAALEKYPDNELLLNCLLMTIPPERSGEKLEIGERLLAQTDSDEIKYDVLRLLAQTYHARGEDAMAARCLDAMPELYFLKTEIAAAVTTGEKQLAAIRTTETVCLSTLTAMLALRARLAASPEERAAREKQARALLALCAEREETRAAAERLMEEWDAGTLLDFYE